MGYIILNSSNNLPEVKPGNTLIAFNDKNQLIIKTTEHEKSIDNFAESMKEISKPFYINNINQHLSILYCSDNNNVFTNIQTNGLIILKGKNLTTNVKLYLKKISDINPLNKGFTQFYIINQTNQQVDVYATENDLLEDIKGVRYAKFVLSSNKLYSFVSYFEETEGRILSVDEHIDGEEVIIISPPTQPPYFEKPKHEEKPLNINGEMLDVNAINDKDIFGNI